MSETPVTDHIDQEALFDYCTRAGAVLEQLKNMLGDEIPTSAEAGFAQNALSFCGVRNALELINYAIDELGHWQEGGAE